MATEVGSDFLFNLSGSETPWGCGGHAGSLTGHPFPQYYLAALLVQLPPSTTIIAPFLA